LANSANPGEGGNIILVGHNYNQGWYALNGVFVNIDKLHPGDKIILHAGNGGKFQYGVELVKKVPWRQKNVNELEKHQKFLWPKENEQLTLVTCGGANVWTWSHRVYVVAKPIDHNNP
jgi:LPXTG-site transpeptidase (sortase) family protein